MIKTISFHDAIHSLTLPEFNNNLFASADWLSVLDKTYRLKMFVKYVERGGKVGSYIIYSVVKNFLEWKICSLSYCDYFDNRVETLEDWKALFESIRTDYPKYRIAIRNLRDALARQSPDFKVLSKERYHWLDKFQLRKRKWRRERLRHFALQRHYLMDRHRCDGDGGLGEL